MARKPKDEKPDEAPAVEAVEQAPAPPRWATHESDAVEQMCAVTITDAVKPLGRSRVELKDPRGSVHAYVRTGHKKILTHRMVLAPPTQRDLRARGWLVAAEVKE